MHADARDARPIPGEWVVLHRVARDTAGPLDSVRTDPRGHYTLAYRATGDTSALYFASTRFGGITYFTSPLRKALVDGADADLIVYDTSSAPVLIRVRGHHVVVMAPDSARSRTVLEVFELTNDSTVTRVAGAAERPTFETALPPGARDFHVAAGDLAPDALTFGDGRVRVFAPLAPGVKQFSFNYRLPATTSAIALPVAAPVAVLEVLVEDMRGSATGIGLKEQPATVLEGRRFKRFLTQDPPAPSTFSVTAPTLLAASSLNVRVALVIVAVGAALLLGLGSSVLRHGPGRRRAARPDDPDGLAREVAALDLAFEQVANPTSDQRADHYEARARLKARLTAALAHRDRLP
jgi:hypothetical protein